MNREIKFRAWDEKRQIMIGTDYPNNWDNDKNENLILMQYTGIKDKNDNMIFEGDVVKCKFVDMVEEYIYKNFVCKWSDTGNGFRFYNEENSEGTIFIDCELEVIGNVFENPDLVEKGAE